MITITEYTPADRGDTEKLIAELQDNLNVLEPEIIVAGEVAPVYVTYLLGENAKKRGAVFIAKKENEAIGLAAMRVEKDQDEQIEYLFVSDLVVTKSERGSGIGTELLQRAEQYAKEIGMHHMKINSLIKNPGAQNLYKKLGFRDYAVIMYKKI